MTTLMTYLVEVVALTETGDESTATRRLRHRIAAESAMHAIRNFMLSDGSHLLSARETGPDRATGLIEAPDAQRSIYRVFAFPV